MQARGEPRRLLIFGLPAKGFIPHLHQQPRQEADDDVVELTERQYRRAEADDDVVELTKRQYRRALGYLIRIEEDEEDIDPMYRRAMTNMRNSAGNSSQLRRPKQEEGESSRGKARRT
ncbi:hypothetical protein F2Q70_00036264 [Brassica cretica]|nr:hypothetical protein F2Q70_00036264 [Brassica cretica]